MGLGATSLELLQVLVKPEEGLILVVLAGDVRAELAEVLELLLNFLGGGLDVRLDTLQVFLVVHLRARISHNLDIFGEELVAILDIFLLALVVVFLLPPCRTSWRTRWKGVLPGHP